MFKTKCRLQQLSSQLKRLYTSEAPSVHTQKYQSLRKFVLDRPEALNALNMDMIDIITPQLKAWQESDLCKAIVLTSKHDSRSFCAGGDVKNIVSLLKTQTPDSTNSALKFFEQEYKLNHLIATTKKPFISILDGITMGGGVGISIHGHFRIITENTRIAMPETSIGLFPDVGASFFLPRLDGELGTFLGLTGHVLKGEDAFIAGLGTHYIPSNRIDSLLARLAELETDDLEVVNAFIDEFSADVSINSFVDWSLGGSIQDMINHCFKFDSIEEIIAALEIKLSDPEDQKVKRFASEQLDILKRVSPTSLKVTLAQLRLGSKLDIATCLRMEYQIVQQFLIHPDFQEGVTAKLVEKREPVWQPPYNAMAHLTPHLIQKIFFSNSSQRKLQLLNKMSYFDYPHRTLSGIPTDRDVQRVINGDGKRGAILPKPQTKQEVLDWIYENWGLYDLGVIGTSGIPMKNSLAGGCGRGKIGLLEKVNFVLDKYVVEDEGSLKWRKI